jgi:hypothetical protein
LVTKREVEMPMFVRSSSKLASVMVRFQPLPETMLVWERVFFWAIAKRTERIKSKFGECAAKTLASLGLDVVRKSYPELGLVWSPRRDR